MKRRGKTIATSAMGIGLAVLVATGIAGKDKALEWWYLRTLASNDLMEKKGAAEKLWRMGSVDTIPLLVNLIRGDHEVRDTFRLTQCYLGVNSTTVVFPIFHPLNTWPMYWPGQVLVQVGRPSIPPLMRVLGDPDDLVGTSAWRALGAIGAPALPPLVEALSDANSKIRLRAVLGIIELCKVKVPRPKALLSHLLQTLEDKNQDVRNAAAYAITMIDIHSLPSWPVHE